MNLSVMTQRYNISYYFLLTLVAATSILLGGCIFGGGDDEITEEAIEEGEGQEQDYAVEDAYGSDDGYSDESYAGDSEEGFDFANSDENSYGGGDDGYAETGDSYTDDDMSSDAMGSGDFTAAAPTGVGAYFVTSDLDVYSSPDGTGDILFRLTAGDTISANMSGGGDYASIGGGYVLASGLSESLVERTPTPNPWR